MTSGDDIERIRTANRLSDNEDREVTLVGLAVDLAGRRCIHLDRNDAIPPLASGTSWFDHEGEIVTATGTLRRHAFQNDPETGVASLELVASSVQTLPPADDGILRTTAQLGPYEGEQVEIEGMAYRSSNGNIVVLYGGLVYVPAVPRWDDTVVTTSVRVEGVLRQGPLPPEAPPAGGAWQIESARLVDVDLA